MWRPFRPETRAGSRSLIWSSRSIFGGYIAATLVTRLVGARSRDGRAGAFRIGALAVYSIIVGLLTALDRGPIDRSGIRSLRGGERHRSARRLRVGRGHDGSAITHRRRRHPRRDDCVAAVWESVCGLVSGQLRSGLLANHRSVASGGRRVAGTAGRGLFQRYGDCWSASSPRALRRRRGWASRSCWGRDDVRGTPEMEIEIEDDVQDALDVAPAPL